MERIKSDSEIKELLTLALRKFDEICRENGLKYSVAYGTLLGAVRHKGFIPWDDDIDVVMPRGDYEKLLALKYNDGRYEIKSHRYSKNYHYIFAKLSDNSTFIKEENRDGQDIGLYVDIFPVDFVTSEYYHKNYDRLNRQIPKYTDIYGKLGPNCNTPNSQLSLKKIAVKYAHKLVMPLAKPLFCAFDKKFTSTQGDYCIKYLLNFSGMINSFKSELWDSLIPMQFENIEVMGFADYDELLTRWYGDYMQLPPVQQRGGHAFEAYYI